MPAAPDSKTKHLRRTPGTAPLVRGRCAAAVQANVKRKFLRFTLYVLLFLLPSACTSLRVTRPVIKIGLVAPFEGTYRYMGYDAIYAARLLVREANGAGGVARGAGYTLELVAYDDGGTIEGALTAARNLALDPDVVVVLGHFRQETTRAALEVYVEAGLSLIAIGASPPSTDSPDYPFVLFWSATDQAIAQTLCAHLASTWPDRRWTLLADEANVSLAQALQEAALRHQVELVTDVTVDESSILASLVSSLSSDGLLLALDPLTAGEAVSTLRESGWDGVVAGGPALASPLFAAVAEEGAWGALCASPYRQPDDPTFVSAYRAVGPHTPPPGPFAQATYEGLTDLLAVVAGVDGVPTRARLEELLPARIIPPEEVYVYRLTASGPVKDRLAPAGKVGEP